MTAGMKSSEFWLTIALLLVGTVLAISDKIDAQEFFTWATVAVGAYAGSRGLAKVTPTAVTGTASAGSPTAGDPPPA